MRRVFGVTDKKNKWWPAIVFVFCGLVFAAIVNKAWWYVNGFALITLLLAALMVAVATEINWEEGAVRKSVFGALTFVLFGVWAVLLWAYLTPPWGLLYLDLTTCVGGYMDGYEFEKVLIMLVLPALIPTTGFIAWAEMERADKEKEVV